MATNRPSSDANAFEREALVRRTSLLTEFWQFITHNKKWWLIPIVRAVTVRGVDAARQHRGRAVHLHAVLMTMTSSPHVPRQPNEGAHHRRRGFMGRISPERLLAHVRRVLVLDDLSTGSMSNIEHLWERLVSATASVQRSTSRSSSSSSTAATRPCILPQPLACG